MKREGINPVVAALLLIFITLAAAVLAYIWVAGYTGALTLRENLQPREVLRIDAVKYSGATLTVYVANVGDADTTLVSAYILTEHRTAVCSWSGSIPLPRSSVGAVSLGSCPLKPGAVYIVKVSSSRGVEAAYRVDLSAAPPALQLEAPLFRIASYNSTVYGLPGGAARLSVEVANIGAADGVAYVEVYDHGGALVTRGGVEVKPGSTARTALDASLPSTLGAWTWTVKVLNGATGSYDDERSFAVCTADLLLSSRTAFIYERFEALPTGWENIGGRWSIVSGGWLGSALRGEDDNTGPGEASVYYYATQLSQTEFQALVKLGAVEMNDRVYRGYALLAEAARQTSFYMVSIYPWGNFTSLVIYRQSGERVQLSENGTRYASEWYTLYFAYAYRDARNYFTAILYDHKGGHIASVAASDAAFQPRYFGIEVDWIRGPPKFNPALFDELVVATGDPRYVTVSGLPSGWRVELWQDTALVASAEADASGVAALNVLQQPIVERAAFTVRDEQGQLVLIKSFDLVVGGDAYQFTRG